MANEISYFGLRPVRHINGSSWNGLTEKCCVSPADALYIGDPVLVETGAHARALFTTVGLSDLLDEDPIYGVVVSFDNEKDTSTSKMWKPALTARYANVCNDPTVVYHIRDDGSSVPDATWPFLNAEMVNAGGSAITGLSGSGIAGGSHDADQSNPLLIIRRADLPNNALSINAIWEVMINTHQLLNGGIVGNAAGVAKG